MTRQTFPYLRAGGAFGQGAKVHRFHTNMNAVGSEICIRLTVAGEAVHLTSRTLGAFTMEDLKSEIGRVCDEHNVPSFV